MKRRSVQYISSKNLILSWSWSHPSQDVLKWVNWFYCILWSDAWFVSGIPCRARRWVFQFQPGPGKRQLAFNFIRECTVLPVVLYGCKTWLLASTEEQRLGAFRTKWWEGYFYPRNRNLGYRKCNVLNETSRLRNMRCLGRVTHLERLENAYTVLVSIPYLKEIDLLQDLDVEWTIILKWILYK